VKEKDIKLPGIQRRTEWESLDADTEPKNFHIDVSKVDQDLGVDILFKLYTLKQPGDLPKKLLVIRGDNFYNYVGKNYTANKIYLSELQEIQNLDTRFIRKIHWDSDEHKVVVQVQMQDEDNLGGLSYIRRPIVNGLIKKKRKRMFGLF